jgi:hypothetical protein
MTKLINKIALGLMALIILSSLGACSNKSGKAEESEGEVGRYVPMEEGAVLDTKTGKVYLISDGKAIYLDFVKDAKRSENSNWK